MSWNYRVIRIVDSVGEPCFAVHEVYYDDAGNPTSWTEYPTDVFSESVDGITEVLAMMAKGAAKPVLEITPDYTGLREWPPSPRSLGSET